MSTAPRRAIEVMAYHPPVPGSDGHLGTLVDDPDWRDAALCAQSDPESWFPEKGDPGGAHTRAVKICLRCPVRPQCLDYALDNGMRHGTWGGLSERQRRGLHAAREHLNGAAALAA